jgi:hypothetical protein
MAVSNLMNIMFKLNLLAVRQAIYKARLGGKTEWNLLLQLLKDVVQYEFIRAFLM